MIGTSLGPYKIIEQIGAGGMGEVYLFMTAVAGADTPPAPLRVILNPDRR